MRYGIYSNGSGQILKVVNCPDDHLYDLIPIGCSYIELPEGDDSTHYVADGIAMLLPEQPSPAHVFDWIIKQWIDPRTLADYQAAKWEEVKLWRAAALVAPVLSTRFGMFDADDAAVESVKNTVIGLGEASKIGMAPASIIWTLADNSAVVLTPVELSEVSALLLMRGDAAYTRARALRVRIQAATTPEEVEAVNA